MAAARGGHAAQQRRPAPALCGCGDWSSDAILLALESGSPEPGGLVLRRRGILRLTGTSEHLLRPQGRAPDRSTLTADPSQSPWVHPTSGWTERGLAALSPTAGPPMAVARSGAACPQPKINPVPHPGQNLLSRWGLGI